MKLSEFSVKRPVTITMIFILILILGIIGYKSLPLDILPNMEIPSLTVITVYPGANPEDVEKKVSEPLEKRLSTINNLKHITSTSMESISVISLAFNWGTDLEEAANDVRTQLDFANRILPEDAKKPTLVKFDFSQTPISFYALSINPKLKDPSKYVQNNIIDPLMRVKGVGMVLVDGLAEDVVSIELSNKKMEKYNLNYMKVKNILSGYNVSVPDGNINLGRRYIVLRTNGEFKNIEDMANIPLLRAGPKTVYLKDIATVKMGHTRELVSKVRFNRLPGAIIFVQKASGANTVLVQKRVSKKIEKIKKDVGNNVKINLFLSMASFIEDTLHSLGNTLLISILLVIAIVFLMLGNIRGAIIISLSLPFSLIISFIFMYLFGYTINMMSLGALALAVGMIVDSAIVIFENIFRHRYRLGEPLKESAIFAPSEVGMAVTASILTTVAIFFPLIFIKGLIGVMFKQLGVIVTIVLLASLFTALTLIPTLSYFILPKNKKIGKFEKFVDNIWQKFSQWLGRTVRNSLKYGGIVIASLLILFFISLTLIKKVPKEFMPDTDMGRIQLNMQLPSFVNVNETLKVGKQIENLIIKNIPERKLIFTNAGASRNMMISSVNPNNLQIVIRLLDNYPHRRSTDDIANQLKKLITKNIAGYKNFDISTSNPMTQAMGGGSSNAAILEIYGDDLNHMYAVAKKWKKEMINLKGVRNINISYESGKKEIRILPKYDVAMQYGLTPAYIGMFLREVIYGAKVGTYKKHGDVYDVYLNYQNSDVDTLSKIKNLYIITPIGKQVKLNEIATLKEVNGPVNIDRKNRKRVIYLNVILTKSRYLGKITDYFVKHIPKHHEKNITYAIGGNSKDMQDSFKSLIQILLLAIVLVFMVMASQFESLKEPFIIFFSIPFAMTGAFIALWWSNQTLSVNSMIGLIMLIGIVVNNAIVLVDYTNLLRKRGYDLKGAIQEATSNRLRPVLMTALTTIFGMIPLAVSRGIGSESWRTIGITVIGGLTLSTIVTLVLVPNIYYLFEKKSSVEKHTIY